MNSSSYKTQEEYGAGFEGTDALRKKYIKDTPGQRIQQFKTTMNQQTYKTYQEFTAQHKKMYRTHTSDQVKAAWEKYSKAFEMEEGEGDSWVVYDKNTKAQIKPFKTRKGAYDYAAGGGGVVYSAKYYFDNQDDIKSGKPIKKDAVQEAINIRDYMATSEKSQFGGYRPKVVKKGGTLLYLGQASYNTPDEAKDHAEDYLKQYARGISEPRVPSKGSYGLKEEKESYDSWIIKPRDGGKEVKVKAVDKTSAIEIALGRKPSQNEIDFFNFHYILIQEKTNVATLRHMKIVELATKCTDSNLVQTFVEQQYKPQTSALQIKESFRSFVASQKA